MRIAIQPLDQGSRHKETIRIVLDQAMLFAQARLAGEAIMPSP